MSDFIIDITKENDDIILKFESSGNLTNSNLAQSLARVVEKLVEKEEEKKELKLYFFMWMCEYFVGHKLFLLNNYIVRCILAYNEMKKCLKKKSEELSELLDRRL